MSHVAPDNSLPKGPDSKLGEVTSGTAMQSFIVTCELGVEPVSPSRSRVTVLTENKAKGAEFLQKIEEFFDREGLRSEVRRINNLTSIGVFTIECTSRVAERLKSFDGVKGVMGDQPVKGTRPVKD